MRAVIEHKYLTNCTMVKSIQIYYVILTIVSNVLNYSGLFTHLRGMDSYGLEFL